jgi:tRNA pseudouridine55 synthase
MKNPDNSQAVSAPNINIPMGFLLIDKQEGPTSHDIVDMARNILGMRRIGHAGTLDPFASGLLILCIGSATRVSEFLMKKDKSYAFTLVLGAATDSYDKTGKIVLDKREGGGETGAVDEDALRAVLREFTGEIRQTPPAFSAIKIKGRKLYEYARKGERVEAKPRLVTVFSLSLLDYHYPRVTLEAKVSSGTYIRSLGNDIGERLGTGAYVESLRRTSIGNLDVKDALSHGSLEKGRENLIRRIIGIKDMFPEWQRISVPVGLMERIRNGNSIFCEGIYSGPMEGKGVVLVLDEEGKEVCAAILRKENEVWAIKPERMF